MLYGLQPSLYDLDEDSYYDLTDYKPKTTDEKVELTPVVESAPSQEISVNTKIPLPVFSMATEMQVNGLVVTVTGSKDIAIVNDTRFLRKVLHHIVTGKERSSMIDKDDIGTECNVSSLGISFLMRLEYSMRYPKQQKLIIRVVI